jgi:hypothetical protein
MARFRECMILIPPLAERWVYWNTLVCPSVRPSVCPSPNLVYATSHLSFVGFYSFLLSWLAMIWSSRHLLFRFLRWLIFAIVISLFMLVWPYVRPLILCMLLVLCRILWTSQTNTFPIGCIEGSIKVLPHNHSCSLRLSLLWSLHKSKNTTLFHNPEHLVSFMYLIQSR